MIKLIDSDKYDLSPVCRQDVFGTRIEAYYLTYKAKFDFMKIWVQYTGEEMTAALSLIDGSMTLCCLDNADFEEIEFFIKMTPFDSLQCDRKIAKKIGLSEGIWGYVVRCEKEREITDIPELEQVIDYKDVYSIIHDAKLIGVGEYLPWLSDVTYRVKNNTAKALLALYDGEPAACAMKLFETDSAVLLGAVATKPEFRGKGIAGKIVGMLVNETLSQGKRVELLCKNDTIVNFYRSLGFDVVGEWSIIGG